MNEYLFKLRKAQLEILTELIRVSNILNTPFFMVGGTLLGAARHKGFIPWDDDMDFGMLRKDYSRFIKLSNQFLSKDFFLHNHLSDKKYWLPFSKLKMNNTEFIENSIVNLKTHKGIFIDIFPIDNAFQKCTIFHKVQSLIVRSISSVIQEKLHIFKNIEFNLFNEFLKLFTVLQLNYIQIFFMTINRNNNSKSVINLGSNYSHLKQTFLRSDFLPFVNLEFENISLPAPKEYKLVLRKLYGNFMKLPPENKRITHKPIGIKFPND